MPIRVLYHCCALNHWESVVRDQCAKILFSGLYDATDAIHCVCVGPEARRCGGLLQNFGFKFKVEACVPEDLSGERITLRHIPSVVKPEDCVLYIHTKGVTKIPPSECVYWWNLYMEYFLIRHHRQCVDLLATSDVVGLDYYPQSLPHFSGNFWWARGDYLLSLPPPDLEPGKDRYQNTETWVCGGATDKKPRLAQIAHSRNDHYTAALYAYRYVDAEP